MLSMSYGVGIESKQSSPSSSLYGRAGDSLRLMQAVQKTHHRVICVTGMPRTGKTALVSKVITQLRQQLEASALGAAARTTGI